MTFESLAVSGSVENFSGLLGISHASPEKRL
jgi:hypothetical protein